MIRDLQDILQLPAKNNDIIVLYSGGLDGTYLISKLKDHGFKNITAVHFDISHDNNVAKVRNRMETLNVKYDIIDNIENFIEDYVYEAIKMKALYNGVYPISASLSRPFISKGIIEYITAEKLNNPIVLHTSNYSQNSLRRFNNSISDLGYKGLFGTPFERMHVSRAEKLNYLKSKQIAFDLKISSEDTNIWCREFEYGSFDNVENIQIPDEAFIWTKRVNGKDETLQIQFKAGVPVSINEMFLSPRNMILELRKIIGKFGIGRYIGLEEIASKHRVLEIRESPAAAILIDAVKMLEMATYDYDTYSRKVNIEQQWIKEASEGRWFGKERSRLNLEISELTNKLSGTVTYKLTQNSFFPVSIKSEHPNYINDRDIFEQKQE